MDLDAPLTANALAQTIQLSIAPVFLLSAVGIILGVLMNRLSRIVDRWRALEAAGADPQMQRERTILEQRRRLILQAINMCTYSAVLIAGVIASLFVGAFIHSDLSPPVGWVFVAAMITLIIGLLNFLREVRAALRWVRRGSAGAGV